MSNMVVDIIIFYFVMAVFVDAVDCGDQCQEDNDYHKNRQ